MKVAAAERFLSGAAGVAMRDLFVAVVVLGAGLAMVVSVCLIALTSRLNDDAALIANAVESVRLGKSMERLITLHHRTEDGRARAKIGEEVRRAVEQASRFLATSEERAVFESVRERVSEYLVAAKGGRHELETASATILRLVDVNVAHVAEIHGRMRRRNLIANALGGGAAVLVLFGAAALIVWSRRAALRPIGQIHEAMRRYGAGDSEARAAVEGFHELAEIASVFNHLADSLDERHRRQLAFLAGVAHDLRNPLSAMTLAVQGLPVALDNPERRSRTIGLLTRQMQQLDRLLMDFVDASRIEAGELKLALARCDLGTLLREVASLFSGSTDEHEIRLELPQQPIELECDSTRVGQVVANLLSNAIKYSPRGGHIEVAAAHVGSDVCLSVVDHGIGIAFDQQSHIFEPFRRASASADIPGTGLGLFVVRRLVHAHGGRIELESQEGVGSTFRVFLPRARRTERERTHAPAAMPAV